MVKITIEEKKNMVEVQASGEFRARSVVPDREAAVLDITNWLEDWARRDGEPTR